MKKKKGKYSKIKIVNKTKFIRSILITILIIILLIIGISILIFAKNNENDNVEETQGEVVNSENQNTEKQNEIKEGENTVQESTEETNITKEETEITETEESDAEVEIVVDGNIDLEIQNLIQTIMQQNGLNENNFGFFYYNVNQNIGYKYNVNKYFQGASTIKVPVAMVYYDRLNAGTITKETKLKYTQNCYEAGGGTTAATYKVGSSVPLSFLLEQSIVNSDNTAVNILIRNIGYSACKKEMQKYSDEEMPADYYTSNIITPEFEFDIITYLYNNSSNYTELLEYMKKSSYGDYLKGELPQYEVAHKYGSYGGNVHDYGIIYGKETYIVGVYTNGIANSQDLIASIAKQIVDTKES